MNVPEPEFTELLLDRAKAFVEIHLIIKENMNSLDNFNNITKLLLIQSQ